MSEKGKPPSRGYIVSGSDATITCTGEDGVERRLYGEVRTPSFAEAMQKAEQALKEFQMLYGDPSAPIPTRTLTMFRPRPPVAVPVKRNPPLVGRNDSCPCGSGEKFKRCCRNG